MSRPTIRLANDLEAEVLLGYVGELIDSYNETEMLNFDRTVLVSVYTQLEAILAGHCDNCDYAYGTSSTEDRCGNCGLCYACCDHEAVPAPTLKPQYEY